MSILGLYDSTASTGILRYTLECLGTRAENEEERSAGMFDWLWAQVPAIMRARMLSWWQRAVQLLLGLWGAPLGCGENLLCWLCSGHLPWSWVPGWLGSVDSRYSLPLPDLHWWPWNSVTQRVTQRGTAWGVSYPDSNGFLTKNGAEGSGSALVFPHLGCWSLYHREYLLSLWQVKETWRFS